MIKGGEMRRNQKDLRKAARGRITWTIQRILEDLSEFKRIEKVKRIAKFGQKFIIFTFFLAISYLISNFGATNK